MCQYSGCLKFIQEWKEENMSGRTLQEIETHIRGRIALLENQRDELVAQANARLTGMNMTIAELKELIGEGPAPAPEKSMETDGNDSKDGPPKE